MDPEVEGEVAGFLSDHLQKDSKEGIITLTQTGLIKRIIEATGATPLPTKCTPAEWETLVKDE
jgi:hypothetical protein